MKHFFSLFFTFVFLAVSIGLLAFAFILTRPPGAPTPETVEELPEEQPEKLESIFLGHPIFISNWTTLEYDWHDIYGADLRHNQRYQNFDHVTFPANQVTDEDIINWAVTHLRVQGIESGAIINLDNGNQLYIWVFSSQAAVNDSFAVSYREQENETANQFNRDWWTIASGRFSLGYDFIRWHDLEENRISSPFE